MKKINLWVKNHRTKLSAVLGIAFFVFSKPTPATLSLGAVPIVAGQLIRFWSAGHIHKNEILTTTGPYSLSRNPLYVGSFVLGTGFIISMGVIWLAMVFLIFFALIYWFTIRWEEEKLARTFPDGWDTYIKTVPRFLPLKSLPVYHPGQFSWAQAVRYKEVLNASFVLFVYGLLWAKAVLAGGA
ncbi:MAG: isoprenylcysteine carboxylmethyltransferase family protein [Pseudomonadota bacterium]|jgi:protein-S-isoprenylcysteine O-methyltransferase Ste14